MTFNLLGGGHRGARWRLAIRAASFYTRYAILDRKAAQALCTGTYREPLTKWKRSYAKSHPNGRSLNLGCFSPIWSAWILKSKRIEKGKWAVILRTLMALSPGWLLTYDLFRFVR